MFGHFCQDALAKLRNWGSPPSDDRGRALWGEAAQLAMVFEAWKRVPPKDPSARPDAIRRVLEMHRAVCDYHAARREEMGARRKP